MRKILVGLLSVVLIVGVLFSCSKKDSTPSTEKPQPTEVVKETEVVEPVTETPEPEAEYHGPACPSVNGKLQVKDSKLCDEKGNPVQLRGVSTHGLAWFPDYVNEECFANLKSWGANVVRLALYTHENGGYCTDGDTKKLEELVRNGVKYAEKQDMYVIVDWHVLNEGNPNTYSVQAKTFFETMSKEFAGKKNVIYEICNEPCKGATWDDVKFYASEVIPVIRDNDKDAVIIVGTPNWSQDVDIVAEDPITEYDNIMYALHYYAATHKEDLQAKMHKALDKKIPIFVSEFGICDASGNGALDIESANKWISILDANGISYVCWNLSNKNESSALFVPESTKTSGFAMEDLSEEGKWLYQVLQSHYTAEVNGESGTLENKTEFLPESDTTPQTNSSSAISQGNLKVYPKISNSWENGGKKFYQYELSIENTGDDVSSWKVELVFDADISLVDGWNGNYKVSGKKLTITNETYNGNIKANATETNIGFIVSGGTVVQ